MADLFARTLLDASYEGETFPVGEFTVDGGHDSAVHRSYLRDGADVETTGMKPYSGTLSVPLLNAADLVKRYGPLFPDKYRILVALFESTPRGNLVHPVRGSFTAHIDGWSERWAPDRRNGLSMDVRWTEHNAESGVLLQTASAPTASRSADVARRAVSTDTALEAITPSIADLYAPFLALYDATSFAALFTAQLAFLDAAVRTWAELNAAFRAMTDPIDRTLGLAAFTFAAQHDARVALEELRAAAWALRTAYVPRSDAAGVYTVPTEMALWQVAQAVYSDSTQTTLLRQANFVADPARIKPGTLIIVPPISTP